MTEARALVVIGIVAAAVVPGCGDEAGSCGQVQPCGGNVVGDYDVSAACTTDLTRGMGLGFDCPAATVGTPSLSVSGSARFNADLGYTLTTTSSATVPVTFPPSCLAPQTGGITLTCEQINQLVPLLIASMPGTIQSATCVGSGDTCTCTVTTVVQTISESGTYDASGTTLTLTRGDGSAVRGSYCVKGNELHIMQINTTMPMMILADTVLTKR